MQIIATKKLVRFAQVYQNKIIISTSIVTYILCVCSKVFYFCEVSFFCNYPFFSTTSLVLGDFPPRNIYPFLLSAHSRRVISHSIPLQSPLRSYSLLQIGIVECCGVYLLFWLPLVLLYHCALASLLSVLPIAISQLHMLQNTLLEV